MKLIIDGIVEVPRANLVIPRHETRDGWTQRDSGLYITASVYFDVVTSGDASHLLKKDGGIDTSAISRHILLTLNGEI